MADDSLAVTQAIPRRLDEAVRSPVSVALVFAVNPVISEGSLGRAQNPELLFRDCGSHV